MMARLPSRTCGKPGCMGIIREDVCSRCGPVKRWGWKDDRERGTRQDRGYDEAWLRTRKAFIEQKTREAAVAGVSPYPICELCGKPVVDKRLLHVDHIKPFEGKDDELRLDPANMRITHFKPCHMSRTAKQRRER